MHLAYWHSWPAYSAINTVNYMGRPQIIFKALKFRDVTGSKGSTDKLITSGNTKWISSENQVQCSKN